MNPLRPRLSRAALLLGLAAIGIGCSPTDTPAAHPEPPVPPPAPAVAFDTTITIDELMNAVVTRQADTIWSAIQFGDDGSPQGPADDDGWKAVRDATLTMAEVSNSLMIPGRHSAPADKQANEGELTPAEIDALIESNRPAWNAFAQALYANAAQTLQAIDSRDVDAMLDLGGTLNDVCEGCHVKFWYPDQAR
jgi:cytochrome c556